MLSSASLIKGNNADACRECPSNRGRRNNQYKRLFLRVECAVGGSAVGLHSANACLGSLIAMRTRPGKASSRRTNMTWTSVLIVVALLAILLLLKNGGQ